jgi:hypothetical protein
MSLSIRFLGEPYPGREIFVPKDQTEVRFGRAAGSEVEFPVDDPGVSREHLALRKVLGGWKFVISAEKPVWTNGRRLLDDEDVPDRIEIVVGAKDGPRLLIENLDQSRTTIGAGPAANEAELLHAETARSGRTLRIVAGLAAAVLIAGGALWWGLTQTGLLVTRTGTDSADAAAVAGTAEASAKEAAEKSAALLARMGELAAAGDTAGRGRDADFRALIDQRRESVYLVSLRAPGNRHMGTGTASVVELPDGTKALATNSHVAEMFLEAQTPGGNLEGFKVVVVQPRPPYKAFEVKRVELHPGYTAWDDYLQALYKEVEKRRSRPPGYIPAYDVALMWVDEQEQLGPALTLASDEELKAVRAGDPIFYVGYPAENLSLYDFDRPQPTAQTGIVTANTTFLSFAGPFEDNQLVQHSAPAIGGASGSPIFNKDGHVIAYLNAGNLDMVRDKEGRPIRVPMSALINFAQRVDLLRELAEGRAEARMTYYRALWDESAKLFRVGPADGMESKAARLGARDKTVPVLVTSQDVTAETRTDALGGRRAVTLELSLEAAGEYYAFAGAADRRNVRLMAAAPDGSEAGTGGRASFFSELQIEAAAPGTYVFTVIDDAEDPAADTSSPGTFVFRVYRMTKPAGG